MINKKPRKRSAEEWHQINIARNAIVAFVKKNGRPSNCENCDVICPKGAEAHHHDYTKPLEVKWLCRKCHKKFDVELNRARILLEAVTTYLTEIGAIPAKKSP